MPVLLSNERTIMSKPSIVFLGAHQDDIAMAAGTLLRLKDQYKIHDWCLTRGQRGYDMEGERPDSLAKPPSDEISAIRSTEEAEVCRMLDADLLFFDEMDAELFAGKEICHRVAQELLRVKPAAVFTLWPMEKADHSAAAQIGRMALFLSDLYWTTELYMCLFLAEDHYFPRPDIFVNISGVMEQKQELIRCYKSQWSEGTAEWMIQQDSFCGRMARCDYAEPFATGLANMGTRWDRKAPCILRDL
jgi:LmbE family N-acetylglucosaminyl deacetylase